MTSDRNGKEASQETEEENPAGCAGEGNKVKENYRRREKDDRFDKFEFCIEITRKSSEGKEGEGGEVEYGR